MTRRRLALAPEVDYTPCVPEAPHTLATVGTPKGPRNPPVPPPPASSASAEGGSGVAQLLMPGLRACEYCGGPIPKGRRGTRQLCSGRCRQLGSRWRRGLKVAAPPCPASPFWSRSPGRGRLEPLPRPTTIAAGGGVVMGPLTRASLVRELAAALDALPLSDGGAELSWSLSVRR